MESIRDMASMIPWEARLIGITGARGCGKTTLMLQHIRKAFTSPYDTVLYVSLDALWFANNSLSSLADHFVKIGGTHLFLDEVHGYPHWSQEIKNIYDAYPELSIVFSGSSLLRINSGEADLSRRALMFTMPGLSFREFLSFETGVSLPKHNLKDILYDHSSLSAEIIKSVRPIKYFPAYLEYGYYPFFLEGRQQYSQRLEAAVRMTLDQELPVLRSIDPVYIPKIKQLIGIIAQSVPFSLNISRISERIGINRQTLLLYLHHLQEASIFFLLNSQGKGINLLKKPDKLYLDNTNLMFLFDTKEPDIGNMRETFISSQLRPTEQLHYTRRGDFLVNQTYTLEVGGSNKNGKQIQGVSDAFIAADEIEYGHGRTIPLWLFGFLY